MSLDGVDLKILEALQSDGRLTNVQLSERVHLSPSPCHRRVKALENMGFITGYRAILCREKIGLPITVFVDVSLDTNKEEPSICFESAVHNIDSIVACYLVSGSADYRLEVVAEDLSSYEETLKAIQRLPSVQSIHSNFSIRTIKNGSSVPLHHYDP
ncbi:Lrp/AsnC family transcriptional regulator [Agaribacterium haliotis]|uniref:Lrp/AsnC family transcriptional regulator n=1 Tax=Agaribacterium haliotis TaxID=2013869 RepID=UPI000BB599F3|nr:Lrp/AsnC family transcriptional regulator [Agaribacterium haliotis]